MVGILVEIGNMGGTIYATLQDLSNMRVDFSVPEQQIGALALGGPVTVTTEVGNYSATGGHHSIEPRVDASLHDPGRAGGEPVRRSHPASSWSRPHRCRRRKA